MPFPFAPILLGSHLLVAATGGIPSVDIHKTCRAAASVMTGLLSGTTAEHDQDVCVSSEQAAHEQIIKDWATYSSAERTQCNKSFQAPTLRQFTPSEIGAKPMMPR